MTFGKKRPKNYPFWVTERIHLNQRGKEVKNKMKKILLSLLGLILAISLVGLGAFAYFSDVETSTDNIFTAGTLDMQIADSDQGWFDGTPVTASWKSPSNWAPGETYEATVRLKNVGNIDIKYLFTTYYNYSWTGADLANVIEVVEYNEYIPGHGWIYNMQSPQDLWSLIGDKATPLTLKELIVAWWSGDTSWIDYCTGSGYDVTPGPAIIIGGTYHAKLKLKFMETAGNAYQGATCSFDVQYEGVQDTSQVH